MKLNVIVTSTRPGRKGKIVGDWFADYARAQDTGFEVVMTDLAELDLPLLDEPNHPRLRDYVHDHTKRWSAIVDESDAFVFVLPEYNFTAPPSFVNAIDYLYLEWGYKPAGLVSYGGISGGLRAAQTAKTLLTSVGVMPIPQQVIIPNIAGHVKDGAFVAEEAQISSADVMLKELSKWAGALATIR